MCDIVSHVKCETLSKDTLMKYIKIQRAGDPQKCNRENAGFVTSSKFTYLKNLHAYRSLHAPGLPQGMYHNLLLKLYRMS